ncbi:MAG TPA: hypothetical protein ENJ29_15200 [Bacteroidetes bacterium]|nr:hypothetical protein [Bacteroidota bacterium]
MPPDSTSVLTMIPPDRDIPVSGVIAMILDMPDTLFWVGLTASVMLYVIGWFGGTNLQKGKIFITVTISMTVAALCLPAAAYILTLMLSIFPTGLAISLVFLGYGIFMMGMAISLYETMIVTQNELFNQNNPGG